jgi:hypothetical protein
MGRWLRAKNFNFIFPVHPNSLQIYTTGLLQKHEILKYRDNKTKNPVKNNPLHP